MQKYDDNNQSILGTYYKINPEFIIPTIHDDKNCQEAHRKLITKYTGSHKLLIQTGRLNNEDADGRMCNCSISIQTIEHIIFNCPLTAVIRDTHQIQEEDLQTFVNNSDYVRTYCILSSIEKVLKLK